MSRRSRCCSASIREGGALNRQSLNKTYLKFFLKLNSIEILSFKCNSAADVKDSVAGLAQSIGSAATNPNT